jgi:hypothetical protein
MSRCAVSLRSGESGLGSAMPTSSRTHESGRNLRGAALVRGLWCCVCGLTSSENRWATLPSAVGTPDKTAHVSVAARIKHKAGDRRYFGKSPALI